MYTVFQKNTKQNTIIHDSLIAFEIKSNRDCMKSGKWQKAGEMPINLSIF